METTSCNNCNKPIKGISCSVKNCVHHDQETHCMAGEINVGPSSAVNSGDTLCATFRQKEGI